MRYAGGMERYDFPTLPDLLAPGLDVVFVGINPSSYAVRQGHYFARKTNRFWPAFSRSRLSERIRATLGVDELRPEHDVLLPTFGYGFTDVVKIASSNASAVTPAMFREWTPRLRERLTTCAPKLACFHGLMGYRPFARHGLGADIAAVTLGLQPVRLGQTQIFVIPNPSPANAHFTLADQTAWYDRLADQLARR